MLRLNLMSSERFLNSITRAAVRKRAMLMGKRRKSSLKERRLKLKHSQMSLRLKMSLIREKRRISKRRRRKRGRSRELMLAVSSRRAKKINQTTLLKILWKISLLQFRLLKTLSTRA